MYHRRSRGASAGDAVRVTSRRQRHTAGDRRAGVGGFLDRPRRAGYTGRVTFSQQPRGRTGIVLGGGGARGAFEAGVLQGIVEALGLRERDPAPFSVFSGTSVGAINATFLASHAHRGDMAVSQLVERWHTLRLARHLRLDVAGFLGLGAGRRGGPRPRFGHHILDPEALEALVTDGVDWPHLRSNVQSGRVHSLVVAALHIGSGRSTMFAELAPDADFHPSGDPRRRHRPGPIGPDHVLASAAIPMIFPARRIGMEYYCDGGIRFNTPIAPAIRCGAGRVVIVSLLRQPTDENASVALAHSGQFPHPAFLLGKILNALLLDPVAYDIYVMERFNRLLEVLEDTLTPEEAARVDQTMIEARGIPYRRIESLVFTPSEDIGHLAALHLKERQRSWRVGDTLWHRLLGVAGRGPASWEADLLSYMLFDGEFAARLIALGRRDALARADEIRAFFAPAPAP